MAFCVKCGKEIEEGNVVCFECAAAELPAQPEAAPVNNQPYGQQPYGQQPYCQPYNPYGMPMPEDKANVGMVILSVLIPIAGLILAIVNWSKSPKAARTYLVAGIISWVVSFIIIFVFSFAMGYGGYYYYY